MVIYKTFLGRAKNIRTPELARLATPISMYGQNITFDKRVAQTPFGDHIDRNWILNTFDPNKKNSINSYSLRLGVIRLISSPAREIKKTE